MANFYIFVATLAMVHCGSQATNSQCSSGSRSVGLSLSSTKNDSGQSTDLFSAHTEHSSALHSITMDSTHNITGNADEPAKVMVFHPKFGSNVLISYNRRTIVKKNFGQPYFGAAFTSRPLENDELFEVILDKIGSKFSYGFAIGVLTVRPEDFEIPALAYDSPHAWMYYGTSIISNNTEKRLNYGVDINQLPAGTRFRVMRKSSSGDIHFYVNGEDQGSAFSGISGPIYGVVDLWANAEKITILNP